MALTHVNPLDLITDTWANSVADAVNANQTAVAATPWVAPTLGGAWANYGAPYQLCGYRKIGDQVYLRGMIRNGTGAAFTLPAGFWPPGTLLVPCVANGAFGYVGIDAAGVVSPAGTPPIDLSSVRFSTI